MAVTWKINTLEYNNDSDKGVIVAHWDATDEEVVGSGDSAVTHYGRYYGSVGFTPDASKSEYIAYDSLTEANVIAWVKAHADVDETAIETAVAAQITESKTPVTMAGVPW